MHYAPGPADRTVVRRIAVVLLGLALLGACDDEEGTAPTPEATALEITPASAELLFGETQQFEAYGVDADGSPAPLPAGASVAWSSGDTTVVRVDADGRVEGRGPGTTTVHARAGGLEGEASVTVLPAQPREEGEAAQDTLGLSGGAVEAVATGGTGYRLTVPAGALGEPTEISLTPVASIENLPLSGPLVAAVAFAPDGLTFTVPAELRVVLDSPPPAGTVGFAFDGEGRVRPVPHEVRNDTLLFRVGHFSGVGAAGASLQDLSALLSSTAQTAEARAEALLAAHLAEAEAAGEPPDPVRITEILGTWYRDGVKPALERAAADPRPESVDAAIRQYAAWLAAVQAWAPEGALEEEAAQAKELAREALRRAITARNDACAEQNDWRLAAKVLQWAEVAVMLGLESEEVGLTLRGVLAELCVQVEVVEAEMPDTIGPDETIELALTAGISVGGRPPVFEPRLDVLLQGGSSAVVVPQEGTTDADGGFTAEVRLADGSRRAEVIAQLLFGPLPGVDAVVERAADGTLAFEVLVGPNEFDASRGKSITIANGDEAQVVATLLQGRGAYVGEEVTFSLDGSGTLASTAAAVDPEGGARTLFTAPATGTGTTTVYGRYLDEAGTLREDSATIQYGPCATVDAAGPVREGDVVVETVAALDSLADVVQVTGDLTIRVPALTDLSPLSSLACVGGNLVIQDGQGMVDLTGLGALRRVAGFLNVFGTDLESLAGLEALEYVGMLVIQSNPRLRDLAGLDSLVEIGGDLRIVGNELLADLLGLRGLDAVGGDVWVSANGALTDLQGLEFLYRVEGNLEIRYNPALERLTGLDNLGFIGGSLLIVENPALADLTALDGLTEIGGNLQISGDQALSDPTGLASLERVGGDLDITNSDLVSLAGLERLSEIGGAMDIYGNAALETIGGLSGLRQVGGSIYIADHERLANLAGLGNGLVVGGFVSIVDNVALGTLGFDIARVGAYVRLQGNGPMSSLNGLGRIRVESYVDIVENRLSGLSGLRGLTIVDSYLAIRNNIGFDDEYAEEYTSSGIRFIGDEPDIRIYGNVR